MVRGPQPAADAPFDPDTLRDRYRRERDKRLRAEGSAQYVEVAGPFAAYLEDPYVDRVDEGGRPKGLLGLVGQARRLSTARYDRVYDLQTSSRSAGYFWAFAPFFPEWSGISKGASHQVSSSAEAARVERSLSSQSDSWSLFCSSPPNNKRPIKSNSL